MSAQRIPTPFQGSDAEAHGLIISVLENIETGLSRVNARLDAQNGRVRKTEVAIGRLQWAVFIVGPAIIAALAYLIDMHLRR